MCHNEVRHWQIAPVDKILQTESLYRLHMYGISHLHSAFAASTPWTWICGFPSSSIRSLDGGKPLECSRSIGSCSHQWLQRAGVWTVPLNSGKFLVDAVDLQLESKYWRCLQNFYMSLPGIDFLGSHSGHHLPVSSAFDHLPWSYLPTMQFNAIHMH